jgi:hypothetical protein
MFFAPELVLDGTGSVRSRFHVLRSRTHFRRYKGCRAPCFTRPDSFLALSRASGPVFNFCAPEIVFVVTECVGSHFHVLRARTHFRRYRGRPILFSCFPLQYMFSAVSRASGPVFMFCVPVLVFGGTEGVASHFLDLRSLTRFRWYQRRRVPFSCFARPKSFSAVPTASNPVFMFCALRLIFGGTDGVRSHFHVLRAQPHFRRCRGRRVSFSCFARPDSFSEVPRASSPVFMFYVPGLIFAGTEGVRSRFYV